MGPMLPSSKMDLPLGKAVPIRDLLCEADTHHGGSHAWAGGSPREAATLWDAWAGAAPDRTHGPMENRAHTRAHFAGRTCDSFLRDCTLGRDPHWSSSRRTAASGKDS